LEQKFMGIELQYYIFIFLEGYYYEEKSFEGCRFRFST
jgi:hypothetical protein